jgi:hypothetical protein
MTMMARGAGKARIVPTSQGVPPVGRFESLEDAN